MVSSPEGEMKRPIETVMPCFGCKTSGSTQINVEKLPKKSGNKKGTSLLMTNEESDDDVYDYNEDKR